MDYNQLSFPQLCNVLVYELTEVYLQYQNSNGYFHLMSSVDSDLNFIHDQHLLEGFVASSLSIFFIMHLVNFTLYYFLWSFFVDFAVLLTFSIIVNSLSIEINNLKCTINVFLKPVL